ncbi:MAG: prolyl aminopeptidase [Kangiellaceae bacterium]|nr:prolyl aminopeptidase [Kangiellaceae bacterium]
MQPLYPEIKSNQTYTLETDDGHQVYYEESGSIDGIPLVLLHGGPGAGCTPRYRRYSDPEKYRVILVDQRGSGRSTPHAELENNTTQHLIKDLEAIRQNLGIEKWVVMGGSWGVTLALAYAETHPQQVLGMILRGTFLGRKQDIDWLYSDGTRRIFPDYWQEFVQPIPENEQCDIVSAFHKRLTGQNELAKMGAAKAWSYWEAVVATLEPNHSLVDSFSNPHLAIGMARISTHYFINKCFLEENQLLDNAHQLKGIPGIIIHGRYDMLCPVENAWSLQAVWPDAEVRIIRDAGHSATEAGIIDALVRATKTMYQELKHDCSDPTSN